MLKITCNTLFKHNYRLNFYIKIYLYLLNFSAVWKGNCSSSPHPHQREGQVGCWPNPDSAGRPLLEVCGESPGTVWWDVGRCIYWDNHMAFIFQFVNVVYNIDWFADMKNPCIPGIKPTWSWCMIFLMCCWILIARILLRSFASMFISDIGL